MICEALTEEEEKTRSYDPFVQDEAEGEEAQQEDPMEGLFTDRNRATL